MYMKWDDENQIPASPLEERLPVYSFGYLSCLLPDEPQPSGEHRLKWEKQSGDSGPFIKGTWFGPEVPQLATRTQINLKHRELEVSPIMVFGEPFDCDERSEIRMRDAIAYWDLRPLEPGVFEEREIEGVVTKIVIWTKGDNSFVELTRDQLQLIFNEMLAQRAVRGAILFASLRRFKDDPNTTLRDINDPASWGI